MRVYYYHYHAVAFKGTDNETHLDGIIGWRVRIDDTRYYDVKKEIINHFSANFPILKDLDFHKLILESLSFLHVEKFYAL